MQILANLCTLILTQSNKVRKLETIISTFKGLCKCENISGVYPLGLLCLHNPVTQLLPEKPDKDYQL